ncbi:hypothetical protein CFN78_19170 [Amycolatopsis antarctica]|uniref:Chaplin domain-containing protein n=1 Tax=Amycolatopsis antarctica TaxID=1854586 RepID=A0A263CZP6_9PSEU|nr:hypothetical protein [Amycolatopsis antarctica]OZM71643.1 hypothetical protein CFN78_19170 [Amycolatopsis antarctica]
MLKKAGIVVTGAAALMMIGGTAFAAGEPVHEGPHYGDDHGQSIGFLNDLDVLDNINVCGNQANGIAVPVLNEVGADCSAASADEN